MTAYHYSSKNNDIGLFYDGAVMSLGSRKRLTSTVEEDIKEQVFSFILQADNSNKHDAYYFDSNGKMTTIRETGIISKVSISTLNKDKSFDFSNVYFRKPGTYTFSLKEVIPEDASEKDGMRTLGDITYPEDMYKLTVHVDENRKRLNFRHGYKNPRPHFCNRSTLIIHI